MLQVNCGPLDVNLPTRPFWFPCNCVHVHYVRVLGYGPSVVRMAVQRVPHVRCEPRGTNLSTQPFHFT